jgi:uracil-DNA glycosylase
MAELTRDEAGSTAAPFVPVAATLADLATAAVECRGCELYGNASHTVFGAGSTDASAMFVGEQPGDVEDQRGEPFVGPAGKLLDRALVDAGIDRDRSYVTNAVKHFRWRSTESSKRRIHERPEARHVRACQPWLAAELTVVAPKLVVALGAVAAQALFGSSFRLTQHRGELLSWPPPLGPYAADATPIEAAIATVHPSAVLRVPPGDRQDAYRGLVNDLGLVSRALG